MDRLLNIALDTFGGINVLVNCAGIIPLSSVESCDIDLFHIMIATNLRGTFVVLGRVAKYIMHGGRIIVFSSSVIPMAFPTYGPYIASKAGVEYLVLVRVFANEVRGINITVNAMVPGLVETEIFLTGKTQLQTEQL